MFTVPNTVGTSLNNMGCADVCTVPNARGNVEIPNVMSTKECVNVLYLLNTTV